MVSNIGTANAYSYNTSVQYTSAKIQVPVKPQYVVYSQLEHISGVAADQNHRGVNLSKVQILNTLIGQLASAKNQPEGTSLTGNESEYQLDYMIWDHQEQIQSTVKMAEVNPFIPGAAAIQPGALFSLTA